MDFLTKMINILKLPFRFIVLISIVMGLLLFLPASLISTLKLSEFITEFGKYIGITFIFSIGYILISIFPFLYKIFQNKSKIKKFKTTIIEKLEKLTYSEKCFLREFFIQRKDVIEAPLECTEYISLYNKKIVQVASTNVRSFVFGKYISILINPLIKDKITDNHIGLLSSEPTQEELEKVKSERPDFLVNLELINNIMSGRGLY